MRCTVTSCQHPADLAWQPFGPSDTPLSFPTLGSHARGFPALRICDEHRDWLRAGHLVTFRYRGHSYAANDHGVTVVEEQ